MTLIKKIYTFINIFLFFFANLLITTGLAIFYALSNTSEFINPKLFWSFIVVYLVISLLVFFRIRKFLKEIKALITTLNNYGTDINKTGLDFNTFKNIQDIKKCFSEIAFMMDKERLGKQIFYEIANSFNNYAGFDELVHKLLAIVSNHFKATYGYITLLQDSKLKLVTVYGIEDTKLDNVKLKLKNIAESVFLNKKPLIINNVDSTGNTNSKCITVNDDVNSLIVVPLFVGQKTIGSIILESTFKEGFNQDDLNLLTTISPEIGLAIEVAQLYNTLQIFAYTDGLTGLYNHRFFLQRFEEEFNRAARYNRKLSVLMIDLDNFKNYNDKYGHVVGDVLLKNIASLIKKEIRNSDIAARYGGEEFIIILPETDKEEAYQVSERIRETIEKFDFDVLSYEEEVEQNINEPTIDKELGTGNDNLNDNIFSSYKSFLLNWLFQFTEDKRDKLIIKVTACIGVATYPHDTTSMTDLIKKADIALYKAKKQGKNQVVLYQESYASN